MRALAIAVLVCLALAPRLLRAHPIHTSHAEADYNLQTQRLEIALRVFADDFAHALSVRAGKQLSLEKTPAAEFNAAAFAYVKEHFTVNLRRQSPLALTWVGRELKDAANELWFYFEIALPNGVEGIRVRHALLGESFADQLNAVRVKAGSRQTTLLFPPGQSERTVKFAP